MRLRPILAVGICAILAIVFISHGIRRRAGEVQQAKEQALRSDLAALREAIRTYEAKHHAGPQALRDLVTDGELKSVPIDPVTGSASTWRPTIEETVRTDDFSATARQSTATAIIDVHSGATGRDSATRRWSDY
jgi:general secretion pathway protein G